MNNVHQLPPPKPRPVANIIPLPEGERVVSLTYHGTDVVLITDGGAYRVVHGDTPRLERLKL